MKDIDEKQILIYGSIENKNILKIFDTESKSFSKEFNITKVLDFQIIANKLLLFFEDYFTIIDNNKSIYFVYDTLCDINNRDIIFVDENELCILEIESMKTQKIYIDFKIKLLCQNQNRKIIIVKDDESIVFI
jgi:uncharacterized protein (UPF0216 family)